MTFGITIALVAAAIAYFASRSRSLAFALFYFAFLPFLTLDPAQGGLVTVDGLSGGGNVLWKLGARTLGMAGIATLALMNARALLDVATRPACLPVLLFFLWALLGLPRASDPWVAFFRLGELLAFFVTGALLYVLKSRTARTHDVLRFHALAMVAPLVAAVIYAITHPEIAFHLSADGIQRMGHKFMNSNVLGFCAAILAVWSTYALRCHVVGRGSLDVNAAPSKLRAGEGRMPEALIAALCLILAGYVLFHARSRTAALTVAIGQAILWFPWAGRSGRGAKATGTALLVGASAIAVVLVFAGGLEDWFMRGASTQDITSGTGRTGLWSDLLMLRVPEAPLLGSGYLNLSPSGGFEHAGHHWNNAHNTYLFALVSTGIPGLLLVISIVGLPVVHSFRAIGAADSDGERDARTAIAAFMVMVAAASVTGFGVSGYPNVAMLFHYGLYAFATRPLYARDRCAAPVGESAPESAYEAATPALGGLTQ